MNWKTKVIQSFLLMEDYEENKLAEFTMHGRNGIGR